jgi:peptidoglycan/xylan/chitin deacetylase (PgdA/CDA1 family)
MPVSRLCFALLGLFAAAGSAAEKTPVAPVVIFKLDDLRDNAEARAGFSRAFDVITAKKISASFGVITDSCEGGAEKKSYHDLIRSWDRSGRVEIWSHGYDHVRGEFVGADYAHQLEHLKKSCDLLSSKCGVTVHSFGAPYNASDKVTVEVMNALGTVSVWMFPTVIAGAKQTLLTERVNMETSTGVVSDDAFVTSYKAAMARATPPAYIVVQGHPPYWNDASHAAFARIIDFCKEQGCAFKTAYEYARSVKR